MADDIFDVFKIDVAYNFSVEAVDAYVDDDGAPFDHFFLDKKGFSHCCN